jgi:hypothetical protein
MSRSQISGSTPTANWGSSSPPIAAGWAGERARDRADRARELVAQRAVVGHGLEHVQNALDAQPKGVSAKEVVVSLAPRGSEA